MAADAAEARANAQAADKGKMTRAADLVNTEAAEAEAAGAGRRLTLPSEKGSPSTAGLSSLGQDA